MRVLHILVGFGPGGAENLVRNLLGPDIEYVDFKASLGCSGFKKMFVFFRLWRFLRDHPARIIHAHCLLACAVAALVKRPDQKLIWHEHMSDPWRSGWRRWIEKKMIGMASKVLVPAEAVKRDMISRLNMKGIDSQMISVVRNGVPSIKLNEFFTFGFIGRVSDPVKGAVIFEKACERVHAFRPNTRFVMVGSDRYEVHEDNLFKIPTVNPSNVSLFFKMLDCLVVPSFTEGMPLVILEAFSHGLPVIASEVGGIIEVIKNGENGILVPSGDIKSISSAMLYL